MNIRTVTQIAVTILAFMITAGCSSVNYIPLGSATYPPTDSVKVYRESPNLPYKEIGVITAKSSEDNEENLLKALKESSSNP